MRKFLAQLGICLIALAPTVALADDLAVREPAPDPEASSCGCSAPFGAGGLIRSTAGAVFVSGKTGLVPARAAARFSLPGRIITGPNSATVVEIGNRCRLSVGANQSMEMRRQKGQWCVLTVDADAAAGLPGATSAAAAAGTHLVPFAIASSIAAGSVAISIARDEDRVSK